VVAHRRLVLIAAATLLLSAAASDVRAQGRYRRPVRAVVVAPYYSPFWAYDPWFYDYQWGGIYGPYGPYSPYRHYNVDPGGSVKLEVKPKQAEVYVDGYYAGVVDDFDGAFQRLRIPPGEHEIELFLDGYHAVHQKVYLTPDNTFKLKHDMEKLSGGEQPEPRPQPAYPPQSAGPGPAGQPPYAQPPYGQAPQQPRGRRAPAPNPPRDPRERDPREGRAPEASAYGTLSVRVQPGTADIVIDGEKWRGPEGQERIFIELPEGRHNVEVQKSGYRTYVTEVDVRRGETTPLNVSLRTQEEP
jgi:hypothetical protein